MKDTEYKLYLDLSGEYFNKSKAYDRHSIICLVFGIVMSSFGLPEVNALLLTGIVFLALAMGFELYSSWLIKQAQRWADLASEEMRKPKGELNEPK